MAKKDQQLQAVVRMYKQATGKTVADMNDVAEYAEKTLNWRMPKPPSPRQLLAKQLSQAQRAEYKRNPRTGDPYRVNHAMVISQGEKQLTLWMGIEDATRGQMALSVGQRREQMVGDAYHAVVDTEAWNDLHPEDKQLSFETDFGPDVHWRRHTPKDNAA